MRMCGASGVVDPYALHIANSFVDACALRRVMPCKEQFMTRAVRRLLVSAVLVVAAVAIGAPAIHAQGSSTSSISGTVVDSSGAAVPGAAITARNVANGTVL